MCNNLGLDVNWGDLIEIMKSGPFVYLSAGSGCIGTTITYNWCLSCQVILIAFSFFFYVSIYQSFSFIRGLDSRLWVTSSCASPLTPWTKVSKGMPYFLNLWILNRVGLSFFGGPVDDSCLQVLGFHKPIIELPAYWLTWTCLEQHGFSNSRYWCAGSISWGDNLSWFLYDFLD